jgi:hypothetical protein
VPQADVAVIGQAGRTLAGCYRVELDGAPATAEARRVERALRGWIRLTTVPAPDRGWLVAAPTTPADALRDERVLARGAGHDSVAARPALAPSRAAGARWRERPDGGADVEWPAAGGSLRLELRPRGNGLAGAATVTGGSASVAVTLRAAACAPAAPAR